MNTKDKKSISGISIDLIIIDDPYQEPTDNQIETMIKFSADIDSIRSFQNIYPDKPLFNVKNYGDGI